ncbi:uncharacterized protein LOC118434046 [Folsomia candida]|uniref:uncharacterized protein LOC118434046 n=1 Tax=Folsomia candida TaxID=158441 RepID=UPI001604E8A7|nr:uncharacterized protein LOC118434046 [Folsomia candida]
MNWDSASHYCGKFGWRLAEIKTQAQQDLFKSKTESGELWGGFWLGARDSTSISQVTWEGHDWPEDIKLQNFGQQMYFSTPLTCLYLSAWSSSSWATIQCSFEWFSPMCETIPKINYYRF